MKTRPSQPKSQESARSDVGCRGYTLTSNRGVRRRVRVSSNEAYPALPHKALRVAAADHLRHGRRVMGSFSSISVTGFLVIGSCLILYFSSSNHRLEKEKRKRTFLA